MLATGLAQGAWMLRQLAPAGCDDTARCLAVRGRAELLLAEVFITAAGKPEPCRTGTSGCRCRATEPRLSAEYPAIWERLLDAAYLRCRMG